MVEKGLSHDPKNTALLSRLLTAVAAGGEDAEKARMALQALLANGKVSGMVHFALAVDAWQAAAKKSRPASTGSGPTNWPRT